MGTKIFAGVVAALAVASLGATELRGSASTPVFDPAKERLVEPDHVVTLEDGSLGYEIAIVDLDGGVAIKRRRVLVPRCVRRPSGRLAILCRRDMGMYGVMDPGDMNRFPASESVGAGCQRVACSVMSGEDADVEEANLLERVVDAGIIAIQ